MIVYFSATGNCKYVAKAIARATSDKTVSMEGFDSAVNLGEGEQLGFVVPTYGWRVPAIVERFFDRLRLTGRRPSYAFAVSTYGTTPGAAGPFMKKALKEKLSCDLQLFSVKMPDTWTPIFDLSDRAHVEQLNQEADRQLEAVCRAIADRKSSLRMSRQAPAFLLPIANAYYDSMRKTSPFTVEDCCTGCGLCAKRCPVGAIQLRSGKPEWVTAKCEKCLRCLHYCPQFAIQHGPKTKAHGQYHHK